MADVLQGGGAFWGSGKDLDTPRLPSSYAFVVCESKLKSGRLKVVAIHDSIHVSVGDEVDIDKECRPPNGSSRRTGVVHSWYHGIGGGAFSTAEKLRYALYKNPSATSVVVDGYTVKLFDGEWLFPFDYPIPDWVITGKIDTSRISDFARRLELSKEQFLATIELKEINRTLIFNFFEKYSNIDLVHTYAFAQELEVTLKEYLEVFAER